MEIDMDIGVVRLATFIAFAAVLIGILSLA